MRGESQAVAMPRGVTPTDADFDSGARDVTPDKPCLWIRCCDHDAETVTWADPVCSLTAGFGGVSALLARVAALERRLADASG